MSHNFEDIDALFEQMVAHPELAEQLSQIAQPSTVEKGTVASEADDDDPTQKAIYERIGSIVRQLHDSLRELGYEHILDETLREITNSQGRLEYIATLTEQAANRVLNAVDESLPIQDRQIIDAVRMESRWADMIAGKLSSEEVAALATDSRDFALGVSKNAETEKTRLMEIMMAQDFQDITGQIINKVVALTRKLESDLAEILRDYAAVPLGEKEIDLLAGPDVPKVAMAQDDVDSLLADLGF
jgi:chemotaxis protein CheZ